MPARSRTVRGWTADMIPIGMPIRSHRTTAPTTSDAVTGKARAISLVDRHLVLEVEPEVPVQQTVEVVPVLVPEAVLETEPDVRRPGSRAGRVAAGEPGGQVVALPAKKIDIGDERDDAAHTRYTRYDEVAST